MYDVDGNGVIDQDEMTKIVQVIQLFLPPPITQPTVLNKPPLFSSSTCSTHLLPLLLLLPLPLLAPPQAIYDMLGAGATKPQDTAEERAKNIFSRSQLPSSLYLHSPFPHILLEAKASLWFTPVCSSVS